MRPILLLVAAAFLLAFSPMETEAAATRPNVIVILADDLGWHDLGVQGATDIDTPNIDSLARNGIRFTSGYVTAPICSPSRAGLMTGRCQQRFGHETNPGLTLETNAAFGLPLTESTLGNRMKELGYATGWIGKSHLGGDTNLYHPLKRGFDEFFGFIEGHHNYTNTCSTNDVDPIRRGYEAVCETNYLTTAFAREITNFIANHATESFFIYAPFNAVHVPFAATPALYSRISATNFTDPNRYEMAAVLTGLDDAVGAILAQLRALNIESNTLIFFTSDNGAPSPSNGSLNTPFRGYKTQVYEGGIRVPFLMQWKAVLPTNVVVSNMVSTLDILPTAVAAGGGTVPAAWQLDGVNLIPFLTGQTAVPPHTNLFWRIETDGIGEPGESQDGIRAVRSGDWKLLKPGVGSTWELYNLAIDPSETNDLANAQPGVLKQLLALYETWDSQLARPRWAYNNLLYQRPEFILEDIRIGATNVSYLTADFEPGGSSVAFVDGNNALWRGGVDPLTGFFVSGSGRDLAVDSGLAPLAVVGDGPDWGLSANGAELFYTKQGGFGRYQVWRAIFPGNTAVTTPLTMSQTNDSFAPRASLALTNPSVKMAFTVGSNGSGTMSWADETTPASVTAIPRHAGGARNGRWIPGTSDFAYSGNPVAQPVPTQIARYRTATGLPQLISADLGDKTDVWGFRAPEFGGELCYAAVIDHAAIAIYRDLQDNTNGLFSRVATLTFPSNAPPRYIYSMEPIQGLRGFNGVSYFSFTASQNINPQNPGDTGVWIAGLGADTNHPIARRIDDGVGTTNVNVARREPETFLGTREAFVYFTLDDGTNASQLRLAKSGLVRPDFAGPASGFTGLQFRRSFTAGTNDSNGREMFGTETTGIVAHKGRLFAGQGSRMNPFSPAGTNWTGAQILVMESSGARWRVDTNLPPIFRGHLAVETLVEIPLTTAYNSSNAFNSPSNLLICGLSDITNVGATVASARVRDDVTGDWADSHITTTNPSAMISFGSHVDRITGVHHIFAGLSNGQIYRGGYDPTTNTALRWVTNAAELSGVGPITGFAEANGYLYASAGLVASNGGVAGGLFVRRDTNATWRLVYQWHRPVNLTNSPLEDRVMRGLTTVPDPRGGSNDVLVGGRAWSGVIERIDPADDHTVTVELDVREFFARRWNNDLVRQGVVRIAQGGFTAVTNPVTGEPVHLVGVWIEHPAASMAPHNGSHFLVRHLDGTYEAADIDNFTPGVPAGQTLRATRSIVASPFAEDGGSVFYFGGYDTSTNASTNTAWIMRGDWFDWPALMISRPEPPAIQLKWPITATNWVLESTETLGSVTTWSPVAGLSTRSLYEEAQSVAANTNTFFRLRKP